VLDDEGAGRREEQDRLGRPAQQELRDHPERDRGLPQSSRENDQGVPVDRDLGDRLLIPPIVEEAGPNPRVLDRGHRRSAPPVQRPRL